MESQPTESNPVPQPPVQRDHVAEVILPINRNGLAIAAGYVALFSFPFILPAPVALGLGIGALVQLHKTPGKLGRGRAIFAIVYGGIFTVLLLVWLIHAFALASR